MLGQLEVPCELHAISAHRAPDLLVRFVGGAEERGIRVFIAGAGGAAHLPGVVASRTILPVIGVPIPTQVGGGLDSLLSIVQMPKGIPVATVAVGGAENAALLAAEILALADPALGARLQGLPRRTGAFHRGRRVERRPARRALAEPADTGSLYAPRTRGWRTPHERRELGPGRHPRLARAHGPVLLALRRRARGSARSPARSGTGSPAPTAASSSTSIPRLVVTTLPVTDRGQVMLIRRGIAPGFEACGPSRAASSRSTKRSAMLPSARRWRRRACAGRARSIVGLYSRVQAAVVVVAFEARIVGGQPTVTRESLGDPALRPRRDPVARRSRSRRASGRSAIGSPAPAGPAAARSLDDPSADFRGLSRGHAG
jgi:5-(carboxyamino)imidazole ribonucleotide mutase